MKPQKLPVYKQRAKILRQLAKNNVIVVESPTGSGKTTQLPQILYEAGYANQGIIGITQPRRIAAVSVASFIARQQKTTLPGIVGYKMRFEDITAVETRIKVMTDGILLQEIKADYDLSRYSVIIVDEAHERSLNIDFILGLLKRILKKRPEFKVIISSATINAGIFSQYFDDCPIVYIDTVIYPVDIHYCPVETNNNPNALMDKISDLVTEICKGKKPGDILVFLSGVKDINACITALQSNPFESGLEILPLYSRLSSEEQEKVFNDYPKKRKVIVATNIAETSLTIDGIVYVIDSGLAKINYYNPRTFTSSLVEMPISKAACNQRKGRAGRTRPGICYRLYRYAQYEKRELYTLEEIFRTDLSEVIMRMAEIGIRDFENFDFLSSPGIENIKSAINTLELMDALDENRELTKIGQMMAVFPMLPRHSRIIVEAILKYPGVLDDVLIATAFLTTNSPFLLPQGEELEARKAHHAFRDQHGDFVSYLRIFDAFRTARNKEQFCNDHYLDYKGMLEIVNIKEQLTDIVSEMGIPISESAEGADYRDYLCAIGRGLIQFVCIKTARGDYKSLTAEKILIHPGSVMFKDSPKYMVAGEIVKTTKTYARSVSGLKHGWLKDISPSLIALAPGGEEKRKKEERDFTNQIRIGREIFSVKRTRGKRKYVIMPWKKLQQALGQVNQLQHQDYKGLRGTVQYDKYELLPDTALNTILELVPKIELDKGVLGNWPHNKYEFKNSARKILLFIDKLLCLCKKQKKAKQLGFLGLYTDNKGYYWFKCTKSFHSALAESIASLESLADEPVEILKPEERELINTTFRKLSDIFDSSK